ncbi:MAG: hypothetical protein ND866_08065, partial [Pyrinomonadaceae bacterium]|nr:hypothetical protein [Pyrinomonadaceae bacterium]
MPNVSSAISSSVTRRTVVLILLAAFARATPAQQGYKKPPQDVLDILTAAVTPTASVSPARDTMLLATSLRYPPISDLAQPMLRLAGLRINPNTNGPHRYQYAVELTLKRINDGSEIKIDLPLGAKIGAPQWSADGKQFAFTNTTNSGIELWVGDSASGKVRKLKAITVNAVEGDSFQWMPDNRTLLVQLVPAKRRPAPAPSSVPREPNWQESSGRVGPVRTFQDLLKTPYDEDLFEYYATSQLALVDSNSAKVTEVGQPAIFLSEDVAPDGQHILVARIRRPFSYLYPDSSFPRDV